MADTEITVYVTFWLNTQLTWTIYLSTHRS